MNQTCVLCQREFSGPGNIPKPLADNGLCCNRCNFGVIKERFKNYVSTDSNLAKNMESESEIKVSKTPSNTPEERYFVTNTKTLTSELSAQNQHEQNVCVDI